MSVVLIGIHNNPGLLMASALNSILDLMKRKLTERTGAPERSSAGLGGIFGQISDMLGQRARPGGNPRRDVRPASEDPYGDPAGAKGASKPRPASEDPYGDPADQK